MKEVMETIRLVAAASGNSKMHILRSRQSELLKEVLVAAYNPYVTYGVKNFETPIPNETMSYVSWERWKQSLGQLATRQSAGSEARRMIKMELLRTDPDWQELIHRILNRDMDCGINVTTINKVFPGLIPTFSVSLAKTLEQKRITYPVGVETKRDGKRVIAVCMAGQEPILYSRNGHTEPGYQHIRDQLSELVSQKLHADIVFDGELMFGMFGSRKAQEASAEFVIFDMLNWNEWVVQRCDRVWWKRYAALCHLEENFLTDNFPNLITTDSTQANCWNDIEMKYKEVIDAGGEGVMVKDLNAPYLFKRGFHWMKLKPEESEDLVVTGFFEGEGKYQRMLGGIEVDFKGVTVRVGSGFSDAERKAWWDHSANEPLRNLEGDVAVLGRTAEVLYTEITPDGSLRFPRFKCWRTDK